MNPLKLAVALFMMATPLFSMAISEDEVRKSVIKHHPKIKMELEKIDAAKGQARSKKGAAFDTLLSVNSQTRSEGYYSGDVHDIQLSKPLPFLNTSVYGGYRYSSGSFPIYEDQLVTNDGGEFMFGVKVSLLRDGVSTTKIIGYKNALLEVQLSLLSLELEKQQLLKKAVKLYWTWVVYGHVSEAYHELYQISKTRHQGIEARFKKGDIPKTYVLENQQYILQRESDYLQVKQEFKNVARELSLYYRDDHGEPLSLHEVEFSELPSSILSEFEVLKSKQEAIGPSHPQIRALTLLMEQLTNEMKAVRNQRLPSVDLGYEISNDMGGGSASRDPQETKIKARVQIPLERREALGKETEIEAKISKLTEEQSWVQAQLSIAFDNGAASLKTGQRVLKNQKEAKDLSSTLFKAEENRFRSGDSDFFHLNMSQQNLIKATLDYFYTFLDLKKRWVDVEWILI